MKRGPRLELHTKPIVLLNTHGFYDHLLQEAGHAGDALGKWPSNQNPRAVGRRATHEDRYFWIRYLHPVAAYALQPNNAPRAQGGQGLRHKCAQGTRGDGYLVN